MFVWATQRHLTEEFAQNSGALSQVSSWESRALLLAAPGAQVIHEDPYDRSLHSLGASKQCDGCELRGEVRENKTMPYVPPRGVYAVILCSNRSEFWELHCCLHFRGLVARGDMLSGETQSEQLSYRGVKMSPVLPGEQPLLSFLMRLKLLIEAHSKVCGHALEGLDNLNVASASLLDMHLDSNVGCVHIAQ